ncbi:putative protein kinase RLK-Pelle-WAK family [Helianthus annuus]|nr:putative protein kinase RLK-Pelle-WAK family [Helianthus annuus]KAJ0886257.1 putative protein kinase RLK-Pelle-WAK family [Helianthus annuus]
MVESALPTTTTTSSPSSVQWSQLCHHFEFGEILLATQNFDESLVIGRGGFGKVYKGYIKNGSNLVETAIKRLDAMSNQGASEFWAEVEMLSKLRHCHLVTLIGYCNHEKEMILVYEYMPHGTLEDHLHKLGSPLSWCQRLEICIDVKSSNILLDECWEARVSDFGLSKISPRNQQSSYVNTLVKGTFGYFDPNYFATGKLTRKSDVYAFGVVLLEVLCRKRAVDNSLDWGLATWAQDSIKAGSLKGIVDSDIKGEISPKCLKQYARIVDRCLDNHPKNRPTMAEVFLSLEYVLTLQEKINNLTGGNTIIKRIAHMFSFTNDGMSSGMDYGSLMPKKPHISMGFGSLKPKKRKQLMLRKKFLLKNGALLLEDKLRNGVGSIQVFGDEELRKATMNYAESMVLGKGGQGVYKGILPDKRVVAIKKSKISDQEQLEQFIDEIVILGQVNHKNVVRLLGCCLETVVPLLAYEFVSNGTLYHHLHNKTSGATSLSWDSRLRIAHESADAIAYLHSYATRTIIHRDVKSANILLDENYTAKVADFGASEFIPMGHDQISTLFQGTSGYLDPEYLYTGQLTDKSDVYSFGVVLAELLTGLKPIDSKGSREDKTLATYFMKAKREDLLLEIVDRQVLEEATVEQLKETCYLASRCLDKRDKKRPSMKEVTMKLERIRKTKSFNE